MLALKPLVDAFGDIGKPEKVRLFVERLAVYSNHTLRRAVDSLIENYDKRSFPSIAEIRKACREVQEMTGSLVNSPSGNDYQTIRAEHDKVAERASAYAVEFIEHSPLGMEAKAGGWASPLYAFACEAFHVIYQVAHRPEGQFGYDSMKLFNSPLLNARYPQEAAKRIAERKAEILTMLFSKGKRGDFTLHVPPEMIAEWKSRTVSKAA